MTRMRDLDPAGAFGGDTGKSSFKGDGPQAEKGDQRRNKPVRDVGPTAAAPRGLAASLTSALARRVTPHRGKCSVVVQPQRQVTARRNTRRS